MKIKTVRVSAKQNELKIVTKFEGSIVLNCPYCAHSHRYSGNLLKNDTWNCGRCGKDFQVEIIDDICQADVCQMQNNQ